MRLIASLILLLAAVIVAAGQPPQAPRRPAQAPGVCQCTGKADCTCDQLSCFCRACSGRKEPQTVSGVVERFDMAANGMTIDLPYRTYLVLRNAAMTADGKPVTLQGFVLWFQENYKSRTITATLTTDPMQYGLVTAVAFKTEAWPAGNPSSGRKDSGCGCANCPKGGLCNIGWGKFTESCGLRECHWTPAKPGSAVYTATLRMSREVSAGSYSSPFGRVSGTFDQDVPAGTYRVTLTPIGTATPPVVQHDPTVIHLDPQTGRRWRYTPEGPWTWDYLPEPPAPQYTQPFVPQTFAPSFGAMRGGSC